jgi:hypothetical protein
MDISRHKQVEARVQERNPASREKRREGKARRLMAGSDRWVGWYAGKAGAVRRPGRPIWVPELH